VDNDLLRLGSAASLALLVPLLAGPPTAVAQPVDPPTRINADERVVFFPTAAWLSDDGQTWRVPVHGWIFEPEQDDFFRFVALRRLRAALELEPGAPTTETFDERVRLFLVDSERGKRVGIRLGNRDLTLPTSDGDGHFASVLELPADAIERPAEGGRLRFEAVASPGDHREFPGTVHLVPPTGISVVSDVDDTIKVTEVEDREKLIDNTFFEPFQAVEGMAALYTRWADAGAEFHFVSSSPWQLYETLASFAAEAGFPEATWHLSRFRLTGASFRRLFQNPLETKLKEIDRIVENYPKRRFVLVGDSGQQDPELYGRIARKYPDQVARVFIRELGETTEQTRYEKAFEDVPAGTWQVFRDPGELRLPQ
jgi:phosphatidate phosphatase APP1